MKHLEYFFIGVGIMILAASSIVFIPYAIGAMLLRFKVFKGMMSWIDPSEGEKRWFTGFLAMGVAALAYGLGLAALS